MKLATTYTKKVPGQEDYSSEGFGATIEVEVPEEQSQDATVVQQWLQELYDQAKQAVEEQIKTVPRRNGSRPAAQASSLFGRPNGNQSERRPGNSPQATPKQISFLVSLGAKNKLTFADLQRMAQERFAAQDLYRLDKVQASTLIDELKPETARR